MISIFVLLTAGATAQHANAADEPTHELVFDKGGKLSFMQTKTESTNIQSALYVVEINFDIQAMDVKQGVTMQFDKEGHKLRLDQQISNTGVAWGHYIDNIKTSGWSELYVDTTQNAEVSNDVRVYSAGYIEGLLTVVRLSEYHANTHKLLMRTEATKHALKNIKDVFKHQIAYMKEKANLIPHILAEEPDDPYWKHARFMLFQLWGLCDGYNLAAGAFGTHKLALEDLLVLNTGGELGEMIQAYTPKAKQDRRSAQNFVQAGEAISFLQRSSQKAKVFMHNLKVRASRDSFLQKKAEPNSTKEDLLDDAHWEKLLAETGHCSALVRVTADNKDLLMGHTTWNDYSTMTRIFKYYNFHFDGAATMATKIAFSSYPGVITSTDNFYIMDSGLAVMDTSIEVLDPFLWDKVEDFPTMPHIPNFVHLMATNRVAKNGAHWARLFQTQNTGTYTSQWMVVDYNRFRPDRDTLGLWTDRGSVPDDTLWIVEAVPGTIHAEDMSFHLREDGYWPSFNRPYFDDVRKASGFENAQKSRGAIYSWLNNPRAQIFKKIAPTINTLQALKLLMTRNFYPNTGVNPIDPGHDISARMDLSPIMPIPNGGIDAKVVNRCLFSKLQAQSISSPSHSAVPAFEWLNEDGLEKFPGMPHDGLPNRWDFNWVHQTPFTPFEPTAPVAIEC